MQNTWIKLFVELELTVKRRKVVLCVFLPRRNSFLILLPPHISRNTSRTLFSYWFISNNLNNSRSKTSSWSILRRKKTSLHNFSGKKFFPSVVFHRIQQLLIKNSNSHLLQNNKTTTKKKYSHTVTCGIKRQNEE